MTLIMYVIMSFTHKKVYNMFYLDRNFVHGIHHKKL